MTSKKAVINEKPKAKKGFFFRSESVTPSKKTLEVDNTDCNANDTDAKKLMRRSSMICSEGFDKYTYDCHYFGLPAKSPIKQDSAVKTQASKSIEDVSQRFKSIESTSVAVHDKLQERFQASPKPSFQQIPSNQDNLSKNWTPNKLDLRVKSSEVPVSSLQTIPLTFQPDFQAATVAPVNRNRNVVSYKQFDQLHSPESSNAHQKVNSNYKPPLQAIIESVGEIQNLSSANKSPVHSYSSKPVYNRENIKVPFDASIVNISRQNVPSTYKPSSQTDVRYHSVTHPKPDASYSSYRGDSSLQSMSSPYRENRQHITSSETDNNQKFNSFQNSPVHHLPQANIPPSHFTSTSNLQNGKPPFRSNACPSNVTQSRPNSYLASPNLDPLAESVSMSPNFRSISRSSLQSFPNEQPSKKSSFYDKFTRTLSQHSASQPVSNKQETVLKKNVSIKSPLIKRDSVVHPERVDMQRSLFISGRFQNPWPTWSPPTLTNILKFGIARDKSKVPPKQELDLVLPIVKQKFSKLSIPEEGIRVTWIGHSTLLVQMHGLNILTDPMFSERASPSQVVGPKRFREPPCSIHDLPHINAVVISHNHYDHLDYNTIILLNARFGTDIRWFVPLGLQSWMQNVGCENVVELDWWEENCVPEHSDTFFVFTPAQHWSKRTLGDENKVLWGSWCVLGPKYRFFFAGDTGYCEVFKQIGRVHGPFDLSAIPIGAYEPRWFMKYQHVDPEEAVQIHIETRSQKSLAIHWGTFCLANEYYLDPPVKLRNSLEKHEISPECFFTMKHGESKLITQSNNVQKTC